MLGILKNNKFKTSTSQSDITRKYQMVLYADTPKLQIISRNIYYLSKSLDLNVKITL